MFEWAIIDNDDINYETAKKIKAIHPTVIYPVAITRVAAIKIEGKLRLIIYTNMPVKIEKCIDTGCIHLVSCKVIKGEKRGSSGRCTVRT